MKLSACFSGAARALEAHRASQYADSLVAARGNAMFFERSAVIILLSIGMDGCAMNVPEIGEFCDQDYPGDRTKNIPVFTSTAQIEYEIEQKVYCELKYAVQQAEKLDTPNSKRLIPMAGGCKCS
jgi:hypothetical protein